MASKVPDDILPNPLGRIQGLKVKLKTSLSLTPASFASPAAAEEANAALAE